MPACPWRVHRIRSRCCDPRQRERHASRPPRTLRTPDGPQIPTPTQGRTGTALGCRIPKWRSVGFTGTTTDEPPPAAGRGVRTMRRARPPLGLARDRTSGTNQRAGR